jgi:hypothetical protein
MVLGLRIRTGTEATVLQTFALAWRRLRRSPGYTAVLTLALAIGANTAIFSIADSVLFRPLPYRDPDAVYVLRHMDKKTGQRYEMIPLQELQPINDYHRGLSELGMIRGGPRVVAVSANGAEEISTIAVTANYFDILGVRAARGRLFLASDDGRSGRPAVLSYACWQQRFGGDEKIIDRTVALGNMNLDVLGVMPAGFWFPPLPLRRNGGGDDSASATSRPEGRRNAPRRPLRTRRYAGASAGGD